MKLAQHEPFAMPIKEKIWTKTWMTHRGRMEKIWTDHGGSMEEIWTARGGNMEETWRKHGALVFISAMKH